MKNIILLGDSVRMQYQPVVAEKLSDIAVVSSANPEAVKAEWERHGLLKNVDLICTQDMGSKAYCISKIVEMGYKNTNVLMCGDAVGDMKAAESNGVFYYPILVNHENESWGSLVPEALPKFIAGSYEGEYQKKVIGEFLDNLK